MTAFGLSLVAGWFRRASHLFACVFLAEGGEKGREGEWREGSEREKGRERERGREGGRESNRQIADIQ